MSSFLKTKSKKDGSFQEAEENSFPIGLFKVWQEPRAGQKLFVQLAVNRNLIPCSFPFVFEWHKWEPFVIFFLVQVLNDNEKVKAKAEAKERSKANGSSHAILFISHPSLFSGCHRNLFHIP